MEESRARFHNGAILLTALRSHGSRIVEKATSYLPRQLREVLPYDNVAAAELFGTDPRERPHRVAVLTDYLGQLPLKIVLIDSAAQERSRLAASCINRFTQLSVMVGWDSLQDEIEQ